MAGKSVPPRLSGSSWPSLSVQDHRVASRLVPDVRADQRLGRSWPASAGSACSPHALRCSPVVRSPTLSRRRRHPARPGPAAQQLPRQRGQRRIRCGRKVTVPECWTRSCSEPSWWVWKAVRAARLASLPPGRSSGKPAVGQPIADYFSNTIDRFEEAFRKEPGSAAELNMGWQLLASSRQSWGSPAIATCLGKDLRRTDGARSGSIRLPARCWALTP